MSVFRRDRRTAVAGGRTRRPLDGAGAACHAEQLVDGEAEFNGFLGQLFFRDGLIGRLALA